MEDPLRRLRKAPLLPDADARPVPATASDPASRLPHRPPMLLLDAIVATDATGTRIRARRRIDPVDPVFAGHFPGTPLYPGVLLVEMMAQAALATRPPTGDAPIARFTRIRDAAFFAPVHPGDVLDIHAEAEDDGWILTARGQIWRAGELCAISISEAVLDA